MDQKDEEVQESNNKKGGILSRKLRKVLDSQLESDLETQEALSELSTFFTENTLKNRRHLRGEIERRSLTIHSDFLQTFGKVKEALDQVHDEVKSVSEACSTIKDQLEATKSKTRDLVHQTTSLKDRQRSLERKELMVQEFLSRYQLSHEEKKALDEETEVSEDFFAALQHCQAIHGDCKRWLGSCGKQTTALHIMDEMADRQEKAVQRLFRWTVTACRHQNGHDLLAKALATLQIARPALVHDVLDEYCAARRGGLTRAFLDALTLGGPGGTPRPIELHAHDPQRYIGDMLAWLHQTVPLEKENLANLLQQCQDTEKSQAESLAAITEGVCRPLRSRVEQILMAEHGPVVLYQLTNLIRFYSATIGQMVTGHSGLLETLDDLDQMAYGQFLAVLQATVTHQTGRDGQADLDLAPAQSTLALLALLKDILSTTCVMEERPEQLEEIITTVTDPLVVSLQRSAGANLPTTDQDVYMLNSLYQIHSTLALFKFNDERLSKLAADMDLHLDTLSSEQTSSLIANLGLQPICTMVAATPEKLSQVDGMDAQSLRTFLNKLDSFLVAPDTLLLSQARLLVSSNHRKTMAKRSLQVIAASYRQLYEAIMNPKNGYANPESWMNKTPEQVDLLLQL